MTVAELIKILSTCAPDRTVVVGFDDGGDLSGLSSVWEEDTHQGPVVALCYSNDGHIYELVPDDSNEVELT